MPLQDLLFSNIIANPPALNTGAGGWDVLISQFMRDIRGRQGFGLLGRLIDVTSIPTAADGMVIFTCPPGWRAMPLCVIMFSAINPNGTLDFTIDNGGLGEMWAGNVNCAGGSAVFSQRPWLIFPAPEGNNIFASSLTSLQVPIVDGDDPGKNTFRVNRDTAADTTYSFFVLGHSWPSSD